MTETPESRRPTDRADAGGPRAAGVALRVGAALSVAACACALALHAFPASPVAGWAAGPAPAGLGASDLIVVLLAAAAALGLVAFGRDLPRVPTARAADEPSGATDAERELRAELDRAEAARERLLSGISRDLRTPMNGIVGNGDLLLAGELPVAERRYAEALMGSARDTLAVIDALLAPATAAFPEPEPTVARDAAVEGPVARPAEGSARSAPPRGTRSRSVAHARTADGPDDRADGRTASASPPEPPLPAAPVAHVLIVEDNPVNQVVARGLLENLGCTVRIAADGHEAVSAAGERPFDMILMDCQMPRMDGYRATAAIRAHEGPNRGTPIVALTANAMAGDRQRCLDAGMDDYLAKPVWSEDLEDRVRRWVPGPGDAARPAGSDEGASEAGARSVDDVLDDLAARSAQTSGRGDTGRPAGSAPDGVDLPRAA